MVALHLHDNFCVPELTLLLPGNQKPGATGDELPCKDGRGEWQGSAPGVNPQPLLQFQTFFFNLAFSTLG